MFNMLKIDAQLPWFFRRRRGPRCAVPAFFSDPFPGLHPVLKAMGQHLAFGAGGLGAPRVPPVTVVLHW